MPGFPLPDVETVVKNAKTYGRDIAERVIASFIGGTAAVAVAAGPADMFHATFWQSVAVGGFAATAALVKGYVARWRSVTNSASFAKDV